ncbi:MAG: ABC transporter ATP-binding protein [Desulfobacterales bacterium]
MAQIELENVTKRFGNTIAVKNLSIQIQDQEFFALLGPTGAGKTTTLRCIAGLEKPEQGNIYIDQQNVTDWGPAERDVALVFQYYSLYPHYTVRQNLEFPLKSKIRKITPAQMKRKVSEVAGTLRIDHLMDRKTDKLSGGEMQRVAIGRAIVRDPKIFLMDEPLSNLDAKLRESLRAELKGLQMNLGATFLYVTHDQVEAMTMGDRIGVLKDGELVQVGIPFDIYNNPVDTYVATFVGTPTMNLFKGFIEKNRACIQRDLFEFELDPSTLQRLNGFTGEITLGIRPEDFSISPTRGLEGRIYGIENMGMCKIITLKIGEQRLKVSIDAEQEIQMDALFSFQLKQEKLHFFNTDNGQNFLKKS